MTKKEWAFIRSYLADGNVSEAAFSAGYGSTRKSAHELGSRLLEKVGIRRAIETRLKAFAMSQDEVFARISERAVSSAEDFVTVRDKNNPHALPYLDLRKARRNGQLGNIKKIKTTRTPGNHPQEITEVEVHDALPALALLAKCYGMLDQKTPQAGETVADVWEEAKATAKATPEGDTAATNEEGASSPDNDE